MKPQEDVNVYSHIAFCFRVPLCSKSLVRLASEKEEEKRAAFEWEVQDKLAKNSIVIK